MAAAPASLAPAQSETAPLPPPHPVVATIREKLTGPDAGKGAETDDVAALRAFYGARTEPPLWITEMGFSARGQEAVDEIGRADDWGLDAKAFTLPDAGALPANEAAQAEAEIALGLAILKYARLARGGRFKPIEISELLDQAPPVRDPKQVIAEIGAAEAPGAYLQSLHPRHEQFGRLRAALLAARAEETAKDKTAERRIVINMERWRWMPEDLGRSTSSSTRPTSCCTWSRTARRSSRTRLSWARSAMPRRCFRPT
ncbi:MAG: hypothetical protein ACRECX_01610 [Methyloceanibacter sp.]|uniref:hypothetical protein n=1 Tax=Methyloceanibacter sp. TaxID=1965321 RepID=UPI003D6D1556